CASRVRRVSARLVWKANRRAGSSGLARRRGPAQRGHEGVARARLDRRLGPVRQRRPPRLVHPAAQRFKDVPVVAAHGEATTLAGAEQQERGVTLRAEAVANFFEIGRTRPQQRDEVESADRCEDYLAPGTHRERCERVVGIAGDIHAAIIGDPPGAARTAAPWRKGLEPAPGKLWYNPGATRASIRSGEVVSQRTLDPLSLVRIQAPEPL